ncbi:L-2,4-diaminobutyrate decarboxylase, partial [Streptomyces sp. BpilaLS-43]
MPIPPLAGGTAGPAHLRPLLDTVLTALHDGAARRGGPLPAGGPDTVTHHTHTTTGPPHPRPRHRRHHALRTLVTHSPKAPPTPHTPTAPPTSTPRPSPSPRPPTSP